MHVFIVSGHKKFSLFRFLLLRQSVLGPFCPCTNGEEIVFSIDIGIAHDCQHLTVLCSMLTAVILLTWRGWVVGGSQLIYCKCQQIVNL